MTQVSEALRALAEDGAIAALEGTLSAALCRAHNDVHYYCCMYTIYALTKWGCCTPRMVRVLASLAQVVDFCRGGFW